MLYSIGLFGKVRNAFYIPGHRILLLGRLITFATTKLDIHYARTSIAQQFVVFSLFVFFYYKKFQTRRFKSRRSAKKFA